LEVGNYNVIRIVFESNSSPSSCTGREGLSRTGCSIFFVNHYLRISWTIRTFASDAGVVVEVITVIASGTLDTIFPLGLAGKAIRNSFIAPYTD